MITASVSPAIRRGLRDGLIIGLVLTVLEILDTAVLKNPAVMTDDQSADSREKIAAWCLLLVFGLSYVAIGARGRLREPTRFAGGKAGATAGLIAAVALVASEVVTTNVLFDVVVAHLKAVSTPAAPPITHQAMTVAILHTLILLAPLATIVGALLGQIGGSMVDRHHRPPARPPDGERNHTFGRRQAAEHTGVWGSSPRRHNARPGESAKR